MLLTELELDPTPTGVAHLSNYFSLFPSPVKDKRLCSPDTPRIEQLDAHRLKVAHVARDHDQPADKRGGDDPTGTFGARVGYMECGTV